MPKPLLLHHNDADGFGSAFAFWLKYGDRLEYVPLHHQETPYHGMKQSELIGRALIMVDIAFSREELEFLASHLPSLDNIVVIDHHSSAYNEIGDLEFCHYDLEHSAAVLAWKYCFPDEKVPTFFRYIEDRDLWKFEMPYAKEILAALDSYPEDFETWKKLMDRIEDPGEVAGLLLEGKAILRYNDLLIQRLMPLAYKTTIQGHLVPVINTPFFRSEMVNMLAVGQPFAAGYHYNGEVFEFSLRSDVNSSESINVTEIASKFPSGGGHPNAAGFRVKKLRDLDEVEE